MTHISSPKDAVKWVMFVALSCLTNKQTKNNETKMRFSGTKQLFKITLLARFEPELQFAQSYSGAQTASPPPQLPWPPPPLLPPLVCGAQDVTLASQTL